MHHRASPAAASARQGRVGRGGGGGGIRLASNSPAMMKPGLDRSAGVRVVVVGKGKGGEPVGVGRGGSGRRGANPRASSHPAPRRSMPGLEGSRPAVCAGHLRAWTRYRFISQRMWCSGCGG